MNTDTTKTRRPRRAVHERLDDIAADIGRLDPDSLYKLGQRFATQKPLGADILRRGLDEGGTLSERVDAPRPQA